MINAKFTQIFGEKQWYNHSLFYIDYKTCDGIIFFMIFNNKIDTV